MPGGRNQEIREISSDNDSIIEKSDSVLTTIYCLECMGRQQKVCDVQRLMMVF